jgi:hypothetical protein
MLSRRPPSLRSFCEIDSFRHLLAQNLDVTPTPKSVDRLSSFHVLASANRARSFFSAPLYASLPSKRSDDGAGEILGFGQSKVVERFVRDGKRAILPRERRKVNLGTTNSRELNATRGYPINRRCLSRCNHLSVDRNLLRSMERCRQDSLQRDCVASRFHLARDAGAECNVP